ncbi:antimicrobial response protein [Lithospermum erythrorhizon]|uniref:Antimicrobial response protein n=1 Tax=Lithospermum erythrorhizon TaxID=34254 RepID=A0AAV3RHF5_LITER
MKNKVVDFILAKPLYYLEFIRIGGEAGLHEKEAIARVIYDDSRIQSQFPVRLWLSVESGHELLHALALSISNWLDPILQLELVELLKFCKENMLGVERLGMEEERLRYLISTVLRNKEYLVVIDNIQCLRTWDGIKSLFYNTEKGGIVLFMSTNVPDGIGPSTVFRLQGSWLSVDKGNFHHLIFGNRSCPQELETIFLAILRCCRGIPTPVVFMVANYLSSINHSRDNWLKVQQRLVTALLTFKDKTVGTISALMKASEEIDYIHTVSTSIGYSDENLELETKQQEIIKCNEYFLSVELEESLKQLLIDLTESSKKLKRMGIVGMAGIGKTTIAKILYEHPVVIQHFDRQAWIQISLSHCRRDLLVELLQCINKHRHDNICGKTESDLEEDLWRSLKHQRYLMVVDDLWSVADWNGIRRIFPDDNSGSRILFTSRQSNVIECLKCEKIHNMNLLDEQTSWDLMQKKVFGQDISPPDLEDIGKQIAKKCQGLPLVIVVIAGVLMTITKTFESWKAVAESITSTVMSSANHCKELFALSYNHLPCHLKSCFLYMGAFQGGGLEIECQSLARLWIAEGFIIPNDLKSLEQTAEEYLKDLIDRSLVLTARKRSNSKVKTCRLHDLLLEFCINQARMENFLEVIKDSKEEEEEEEEEEDEGLGELPSAGKNDRPCRFSFHCQTFEDITPKSQAGAAFFTACSREVPDIFLYNLDFKLLFILDMIPLQFDSFPVDQVSKLLLLKYLAFTASFELPAVVLRLPKLQTLIINDSRIRSDTTPAPALPHDFWQSMNLRHLQLQEAHYLPTPAEFTEVKLIYLQTLSKVTLASCFTQKTFDCMPNLIKLVVCETMNDFQGDCLWNIFFENLIRLSKLQILKVYCLQMRNSSIRQLPIPCLNAFPETLSKLTLSRSHLPWVRMKILGELPNLEVLKLRNYAFEGPEWETQRGGFQRLEYLLIENTDLQRWEWECDDCFPSLKHLVLKYCHLLEEIPEQIGDCPDLTHIKLQYCSDTAEESAKYIRMQQLEECFHDIELHIQSKLGEYCFCYIYLDKNPSIVSFR